MFGCSLSLDLENFEQFSWAILGNNATLYSSRYGGRHIGDKFVEFKLIFCIPQLNVDLHIAHTYIGAIEILLSVIVFLIFFAL